MIFILKLKKTHYKYDLHLKSKNKKIIRLKIRFGNLTQIGCISRIRV